MFLFNFFLSVLVLCLSKEILILNEEVVLVGSSFTFLKGCTGVLGFFVYMYFLEREFFFYKFLCGVWSYLLVFNDLLLKYQADFRYQLKKKFLSVMFFVSFKSLRLLLINLIRAMFEFGRVFKLLFLYSLRAWCHSVLMSINFRGFHRLDLIIRGFFHEHFWVFFKKRIFRKKKSGRVISRNTKALKHNR